MSDAHETPSPGSAALAGSSAAAARRATEFAYAHLRRLILSGELDAGSSLSQVQLAKRIGVSRTPLREAIRRLQQDGLIHAEVNQRMRVAEAPLKELDDLYALRIITEATAVRMTVSALDDERLARIGQAIERVERTQRAQGDRQFDEAHRAFHMLIVDGAAGRLRACIRESWDHAERYRRLYAVSLGQSGAQQAHQEHRALFDAVAARQAAAAAEHLARHYARVALVLIAHHHPGLDTTGIRTALALVLQSNDA